MPLAMLFRNVLCFINIARPTAKSMPQLDFREALSTPDEKLFSSPATVTAASAVPLDKKTNIFAGGLGAGLGGAMGGLGGSLGGGLGGLGGTLGGIVGGHH